MTYEEAKAKKAEVEARVKACSAALQRFPVGPMGLTPDVVKCSADFKMAKLAYDDAFAALQAFNSRFVRAFKKEIRAERRAALIR